MKSETTKQKEKKAFEALKKEFGYTNQMASPRMVKVVISSATGSGIKRDKNKNDFIIDRLSKITGQKPSVRQAKKSIATFKTRQGDPIGVVVTLRGARMVAFGLAITLVTTSKNKAEAIKFFELLGLPFKK